MPLIDTKTYPKTVIDGFKAALNRNDEWTDSAVQATKDALISYLIGVQGSRCAYCRRLIKDEIGLRELDHVLPKGKLGKSKARARSNLRRDRRVTEGYPAFRFEPSNLILTCRLSRSKSLPVHDVSEWSPARTTSRSVSRTRNRYQLALRVRKEAR